MLTRIDTVTSVYLNIPAILPNAQALFQLLAVKLLGNGASGV